MWPWLMVACGVIAVALTLRRLTVHRRSWNRLFEDDALLSEQPPAAAGAAPVVGRYRWLPWAVAAGAGVVAYLILRAVGVFGQPDLVAAAFALVVGLIGAQLESLVAARRWAKLETQLADAIDLMVGALGVGASAAAALEAALREARHPLKPLLEESLARIRYGDDPQAVFRTLAERVPLETFLLFTSTLAVHWEVGGSLAPTLATVGRTIRDRVETSRRIRSNAAQAQLSTAVVLALTYFVAWRMWRVNSDQMRQFLLSPTANWFVVGTLLLQALGITWMVSISRMRF
ncbi:MAG TPA: type II secretion system F family protein [Planctomycetaceae bacterium]|nr:type II secretion system F family protein [Planctomycetaceae bacterium]